jgi:uncharacterized protein (TIGR00730 family)
MNRDDSGFADQGHDSDREKEVRIRRILESSSYVRADRDLDWINSPEMRGVRLLLEYSKPQLKLARQNVRSTVVVFGGTRIVEPQEARRRLEQARALAVANPEDARLARKVAIAERVVEKSHYYDVAREFSRIVSSAFQTEDERHLVVVTGGGPGIMEAGNRGAFDVGAKSIGFNITLAEEQIPNSYITPELCFRFRYFALRKMHFLAEAKALVAFPGGYGTFDELFETLCLVQTKAIQPVPIVLVGESFWRRAFDVAFLRDEGVIDPEDVELFTYAESAEEIRDQIVEWYEERNLDYGVARPGYRSLE